MTMNRRLTASFAGLILSIASLAQAATVVPAFDLTGAWHFAGGSTASFFQEATQLNFINISGGFSHSFPGRYIAPTRIEGIQHRVNRSTGCSTEMLLTVTAFDSNTVSVSGKALDSNCDLVKGQIYTDTGTRTQ
jgi:hypothetical protein